MDIVKRLDKFKLIDPITGCWLFTGKISKDGHGHINFHGQSTPVHRISAHVYLNFDLSSSLQINHKRDCPNAHCFNPDHIYPGTHDENMKDKEARYAKCPKCGGEYKKYFNIVFQKYKKICPNCNRVRERNRKRKRSSKGKV